ncbi:protein transport protein Sec31A-like isoform X2 [Bolinopsis microptera]|uniref:protein transport protein Sec31A-like isoform X2 n=1 Tax=Bolinopsis microptera TaxID=2820187 RepID=UPI003078ACD3
MRIKEVVRTSNLSWSPGQVHPLYIAAGTSAKQLDASFSSSSVLEILEVETASKGWDMPVRGTLSVASRFNVIEWGSVEREMGLIAGGGDNGVISLWDPVKILSGEEDALECELPKHCGPVRSMDFNPAKKCLLASGASASEIHIVDINKPDVLMTPGPKAQPEDDVVALAWNQQVEHILASAHPNSARSIVWDLRKNEPIIQVTDASNRVRCSCIAWHPDVATQLLTCSDEDRYPVIQMWDLRFASAPTMVFEGHGRGIQTLAWCGCDSSMLLSSSRDDHMICWNPNNTSVPGGEKLVEFNAPSQWTFDMGWCERNPYLVASSAFSGKLSVFSLFGGQEDIPEQPQRVRVSSDPFAPGPPPPSLPMHIPLLSQAPKWLMKPCGGSFGFGGKLISFDSNSNEITVMQVTTESELLERSEKLEQALQENTLLQFCSEKADATNDTNDKQIWSFLKSTFDGKPRQRYLELLGYKAGDLKEMVENLAESAPTLSESVGELTLDSDTAIINKSDAESSSSSEKVTAPKPLVIDTSIGVDGLICRAMLLGQFEVVVDLCLKAGRMADALAVAMAGGRELFQKTQQEYFRQATSPSAALLSCIISQRWANLVETVELSNWKEALAILLSYAKPTEFNGLCDTLADRLSADPNYTLEATLCYICSGNVAELLECWQSANSDDTSSPLQLQELIEKVMCLQSTNSTNRPLEGERVVANLLKYSQLLAEQGKLSNALTYISATPTDAAAEFKYKLHMAINDPSLPRPPVPYTRARLPSAASSVTPSSPAASTYTGYSHSTYNPSSYAPTSYAPSSVGGPPSSVGAPPSSVGAPPSSYTPAASIVSGNSSFAPPAKIAYQPPTYKAPEPQAPTPAPAPDPAPGPPTQPPFSQPPPGSFSQPPPGSLSQPPPGSLSQPPPGSFSQPPPGSFSQPPAPPTSYAQPPTSYTPPAPGSYTGSSVSTFTPYIPAPGTEPSPPPAKLAARPKSAWNDPPMLKKKTASNAPVATQKITTPVVGPVKTVDLDPNSAANYAGQPQPGPGAYNAPQPVQQPYNPNSYAAAPPEPAPAPAPVEKPSVPDHYLPMLNALESATNDCKNVSQNPTHRRKLEEVTAKLEALKDRLRYDCVSGAVVENLNNIASAISVKDYNQALYIHSHVAQTANFSEVGSFLPGIKVLLQIGAQLHTVHHY